MNIQTTGTQVTRDGILTSLPPGHYRGTWSGTTVTIPARSGSPFVLTVNIGLRGTESVIVESTGDGTYSILEGAS